MPRVKFHWVLLVTFAVVWLIGTIGYLVAAGLLLPSPGPLETLRGLPSALYQALQMFVMESPPDVGPAWLHIPRFLAVIVTYSAVLGGAYWLAKDRFWRVRAGLRRNHAVVCGLGEKGFRLLRALSEAGVPVIALEQDEENPHISSAHDLDALVLTGDARDPKALTRARTQRARFLVACCGEDDANAEIAIQARALTGRSDGRVLRAVAHITDPQLAQLLQEQQLRTRKTDSYQLDFFNIYTSGAAALLDEHPPFERTALTESGGSDGTPHVVVIGLGHLGQSVVTALGWAWARTNGGQREPMDITVYAPEAQSKVTTLCRCFPQLTAHAALTVHELDATRPTFDRAELEGRAPPSNVYVCMDEDAASLAAGLSFFRCTRDLKLPVVICLMGDDGVAALLDESASVRDFETLSGFPVLERTCNADIVFGRIARKIHERYLRHAEEEGRTLGGEPSLLPWADLPERLRESNRRQADDMIRKLEAIGYGVAPLDSWEAEPVELSPADVEELARLEHERWVEERRQAGWKPGPEKDVDRKVTPYLAHWDELSEEVKELDRSAVREIPELLLSVHLGIYRRPGK